MAEPMRARRLADQEGSRLQQIVRRGKHGSIRVRRAMITARRGALASVEVPSASPSRCQPSPAMRSDGAVRRNEEEGSGRIGRGAYHAVEGEADGRRVRAVLVANEPDAQREHSPVAGLLWT